MKDKRAMIAIKNSFRICGHKINVGLNFPSFNGSEREVRLSISRKVIPC